MRNPFASDAVGFDTPIAMLIACHDRVRHYAGLLPKLAGHVAIHGADAEAARAALAILRYFDVAVPLHHQDEDDDVFPLLRERGDAALRARVDEIAAEHDALGLQWQTLRPALQALAVGLAATLDAGVVQAFAQDYPAHAAREERELYPHATRLIGADEMAGIGRTMAARRTHKD
ncbi:hemerythrin domain-containing protein [Jeongeupia naejangsanensis]|uniref:Hemerythrin domain-containing protein n=1 Tax=Jeongeupia naejangsanensis TaxID=613195 RepID=A0ABS2BKC0_9NEIS|nr:hemerythrin domain-containing protein [Jeongeupia naejangsanensis]MBM3115895.1 hemerythrin domain-containing protein [Jeongeupia naejangsanensis]